MLETIGDLSWYLVPGKPSALRAVRLPHDRALQTAEKLNADDLLLLKPGAEVSLQIRTQGNQQQITQALTNQLQANGVQVSPNSPIQVIATTKPGKQREVSYRAFGAGFGNTQTRTITEHISRLEVRYQNKIAWETQVVSGPSHFLRLKEGQTLDDALREAQKPDLRFFERVKIPKQIVTPTGTIAYGASQITAGAIKHLGGGL
jgi:hypothetical protein